jgi:Autotransporter beta-domain
MLTSKLRLNMLHSVTMVVRMDGPRPIALSFMWGLGMNFTETMKTGFAATAVSLSLSCVLAVPAKADGEVEQRILTNAITNILQDIRDQIQSRKLLPPPMPGRLRFTAEESDFDNRHPFAAQDPSNPFEALAYTKAYTKAPPLAAPAPTWLFGVNAILSGDRTTSIGSVATTTTAVGAFDATKIGIFTASDALTFLATGSDSWSRIPAQFFNSSMPSGSGTVAYTNGGFSTDFTVTSSWISNSGIAAPANSSLITDTGNVQYKFDLGQSWFIEPTGGVTYTNFYTANFGTSTGTSTEVHGGGRIGTEVMWGAIKLQPSITGAAFEIVSVSGAGGVAAAGAPNVAAQLNQLGGRGSAKVDFIWTSKFSTFVEGHISSVAGTQTVGASGGLRYTF